MEEIIKSQIINTIREEYNTDNIKFVEKENEYKVFGLLKGRYEYIYTVDNNGFILEHKDKNSCP